MQTSVKSKLHRPFQMSRGVLFLSVSLQSKREIPVKQRIVRICLNSFLKD